MHSTKLMWIIVAGVVVCGLFLTGYGLGTATIGRLATNPPSAYQDGYQAGREAARITIAQSGLVPPSPAEVRSVSGTVVSIDGNRIVISGAGKISPNPLDPQGPDQRTIIVTDKTAVRAVVPLTPSEYSAAIDKYNRTKQGLPPNPYDQKDVAFGDIKLTMTITVAAASDISQATEITADTITFNAIPSVVSVK